MSSAQSSGDLIADRRAAHARGYAELRDFAAAAELMEQALEVAPEWAAGWSLLGDWRREAGDAAGAIEAWSEAARRDASGVLGAGLKLAAAGAMPAPRGTETGYVEALFDDYAPRFERELTGRLVYAVPAALMELVAAAGQGSRYARALDLGCGTGLMGERLRGSVSFLEGVDLSQKMLDAAARKGIYDRLDKAEVTDFLGRAGEGQLDLVTAADVLIYMGALRPVFAAVARALGPGGLFAFSVETHADAEPIRLGASLRYSYAPDAVRADLTAAGLDVVTAEAAVLRQDRGFPVAGLLVVARRPQLTAVAIVSGDESEIAAKPLAESH